MEKLFSANSNGTAGLAHGKKLTSNHTQKLFNTNHRSNNMKLLGEKIGDHPHNLEGGKIPPESTNQKQFINGLHKKSKLLLN